MPHAVSCASRPGREESRRRRLKKGNRRDEICRKNPLPCMFEPWRHFRSAPRALTETEFDIPRIPASGRVCVSVWWAWEVSVKIRMAWYKADHRTRQRAYPWTLADLSGTVCTDTGTRLFTASSLPLQCLHSLDSSPGHTYHQSTRQARTSLDRGLLWPRVPWGQLDELRGGLSCVEHAVQDGLANRRNVERDPHRAVPGTSKHMLKDVARLSSVRSDVLTGNSVFS